MAAQIKGKLLVWGIQTAQKTSADTILTASGVVQSFDIDSGGGTTVIGDEDDDAVTRIDHNFENKLSMEVHCVATTAKPPKGTEILGATLGTVDGIAFGTGRTFIDTSKVSYAQGGVKKISITATHYPGMAADA